MYDDDEFLVVRRQLWYGRMKRGVQAATEKIDATMFKSAGINFMDTLFCF